MCQSWFSRARTRRAVLLFSRPNWAIYVFTMMTLLFFEYPIKLTILTFSTQLTDRFPILPMLSTLPKTSIPFLERIGSELKTTKNHFDGYNKEDSSCPKDTTSRERPMSALHLKLKKRKVLKIVQGGAFWGL